MSKQTVTLEDAEKTLVRDYELSGVRRYRRQAEAVRTAAAVVEAAELVVNSTHPDYAERNRRRDALRKALAAHEAACNGEKA